jgi:hypothetical protein
MQFIINDEKLKVSNVGFNSSLGNLKAHVDFIFTDLSELISEVIIGPKSQATEYDIKYFLRKNDFLSSINDSSIQIKKSIASYR